MCIRDRYGKVRLFKQTEIDGLEGQLSLFPDMQQEAAASEEKIPDNICEREHVEEERRLRRTEKAAEPEVQELSLIHIYHVSGLIPGG